MIADYTARIAGRTLEYYDDTHTYLVDGVEVPSVTQIIRATFPDRYAAADPARLAAAAAEGTAVHAAIQDYIENGVTDPARKRMIQHFAFLCERHELTVQGSEVPLILFAHGIPVAAGRCDLVLTRGSKVVGADIKHVSAIDKAYLTAQLNLYRIGYKQSYGVLWDEIAGIQLHGETRKYIPLRINESLADELLLKYAEETQ